MVKGKESGMACHHGMCMKCHSGMLLVLGALVLVNNVWNVLSWGIFIGGLLILVGLLKLVKPMCPHCA